MHGRGSVAITAMTTATPTRAKTVAPTAELVRAPLAALTLPTSPAVDVTAPQEA